jgi:short/branched chain acyl-CoA dehydrogenase
MMLMRHARAPALRAATRPRFAAAGTHASRAFSTVPALEEGEGLHLPCTMLTDDESMMREAATQFAQGVVLPRVEAMDDAGRFDDDIISGLFEQGFMGVEIPEEYDGAGASFTSALLVIEELARVDPAVSVMVDIHNTIVNNTFSMWASPELKQQWLPRLATDTLGAFALSEASSGSDAFALKTTAVQDAGGGDYVLTGEKMWISNSLEAGVFLVMANADPSKGYKGITCFVVPRDAPGLSVGAPEAKLGIKASSTCPLLLDGVRVPKENILGEVGKGYKYAIEILNEGRVGIGAQMVGLAQGALDRCLPYLHERQQFGSSLMGFQGVQHQVAQCATELEAARLLVYNAARMKEAGLPVVKEAAMAKLFCAQVAERTASKCVELMGGVGFTKAYGVEKLYRDAKIGAIYEGTSNIQLNTIAKLIAAQGK